MKTIEFQEKLYNVPTEWQEVTLGMQIKTSELVDILEDAELIAIIAGYTGIPVDELRLSNLKAIEPIVDILDFIYMPYVPVPTNEFIYKEERYSTKHDIAEVCFEDWVSVQTILYNHRDNPVLGLPKILASLYKKADETLDDFNLNDRSGYFMDLPITIARDCEGFFLTNLQAYKGISQLSLIIKEEEKLILSTLIELDNTMIRRKAENGISFSTKLVIMISRIYIWYLKRELERYFNYGRSKPYKRNFNQILKRFHITKAKINK
jgi:hypothetical protein